MIFSLCISNKKIFLHIKPSSYCEDIESKRENTPFNHHYTHTHTHIALTHSCLILASFCSFFFRLNIFFFHSIFTIPGAINQIHQPLCVRRALTTDCMSERESERGVGYSHIHNISFSYVCIKQNVSASYEQNSNNEHNEEKKFFSSMDSCLFFCSLQKNSNSVALLLLRELPLPVSSDVTYQKKLKLFSFGLASLCCLSSKKTVKSSVF